MNLCNYKTKPFIIVIGISYAFFSFILSFAWNNGYLYGFSPVAIISILLLVYDEYLWKKPLLKCLVNVPNLNGDYIGEIEYSYKDKKEKKNCEAKIKQTASKINVEFIFTKETENSTHSNSKRTFFLKNNLHEVDRVAFYYENEGSNINQDGLTPHSGLNILKISPYEETNKFCLEGNYFTNRKPEQTQGKMRLTPKFKKQ